MGRGLYMLPQADITHHHSLVEASQRVPHGIICLLSALHYHGLTTQAPFAVWLAIANKAHRPRFESLPIHLVRFSGPALTGGVEEVLIEGVRVKIYNPAKTVAGFIFGHRALLWSIEQFDQEPPEPAPPSSLPAPRPPVALDVTERDGQAQFRKMTRLELPVGVGRRSAEQKWRRGVPKCPQLPSNDGNCHLLAQAALDTF